MDRVIYWVFINSCLVGIVVSLWKIHVLRDEDHVRRVFECQISCADHLSCYCGCALKNNLAVPEFCEVK